MDKDSTEVSRLGLEVFSLQVSPQYDELRNRLIGLLAAQGSTVEQLKLKEENERANVALLSQFIKSLPSAEFTESRGWQFKTDDPFKVRMLQSNILWRSGSPHKEYMPYYVLGRSDFTYGKKGRERGSSLILGSAGANVNTTNNEIRRSQSSNRSGDIFAINLRMDYKYLEKLQSIASSEYPSPKDMWSLFDLNDRTLVVHGESPGSTRLIDHYNFSDAKLSHVSDEILGRFDVNSYLHNLATSFGIETELNQIILNNQTT